MSDTTTMPFQPGTVEDESAAPEPDDAPGNKRILLLLGALGVLAVILIAAYFLLFAGGNDKAATGVVTAPRSSALASTAPSTAPTTAALPKISARNFGIDPFKPLLTVASAPATTTGTTAAGTTAAGTTAAGTTTTGTTTTGTTTTGTTTTGTTAPGATTPAPATFKFRVIDVAKDNESSRVSVDGTATTVKPGDVFSEKFKAIRFTGGTCGTFQFGDERFDLCEGNTAKLG
jgi:hypothetical protein